MHLVASVTADPRVVSLISVQSHTYIEIDNEIISKSILFLPLIQEGLSVATESMCTKDWLSSLSRNKVWLGELTILPCMTKHRKTKDKSDI